MVWLRGATESLDPKSRGTNHSALRTHHHADLRGLLASALIPPRISALARPEHESVRPTPPNLIWVMQNTRQSNAATGRAAIFMRSPDDSPKPVQPAMRHPFRGAANRRAVGRM